MVAGSVGFGLHVGCVVRGLRTDGFCYWKLGVGCFGWPGRGSVWRMAVVADATGGGCELGASMEARVRAVGLRWMGDSRGDDDEW
ncbi:hypothetical protein V6N11_056225 [Hibiscus sabdariffa]|uniref:Uncharacterized protein n=1 Tax=Hibiscus sabdariffa TaxID=183260 RepID=A0ABR2T3U2_9ROSI